jgi:alcohol dehydrogenase
MIMLSDILPTGHEIGVLYGQVKPGDTIAIVGAGPVGLSALLTAQFYSPAEIIMVDLADNRLDVAKKFGATEVVNSSDGKAIEKIIELTEGKGVDVAIEAVGIPATFDICQEIVTPGGNIASVGVHGKSVELHLERLWIQNITLTMGLVNTNSTPMLLKTVEAKKLQPEQLITHRFPLNEIMKAYDVFVNAAKEQAIKMIMSNDAIIERAWTGPSL